MTQRFKVSCSTNWASQPDPLSQISWMTKIQSKFSSPVTRIWLPVIAKHFLLTAYLQYTVNEWFLFFSCIDVTTPLVFHSHYRHACTVNEWFFCFLLLFHLLRCIHTSCNDISFIRILMSNLHPLILQYIEEHTKTIIVCSGPIKTINENWLPTQKTSYLIPEVNSKPAETICRLLK